MNNDDEQMYVNTWYLVCVFVFIFLFSILLIEYSNTTGQSRYWNLVLNNYTEEDYEMLRSMAGTDYRVIAKEVGEQGTPHLQAFFVFTNRKRLNQVVPLARTWGHWYIKAKKSTPAQSAGYCKKTPNYIEDGVCPQTPQELGGQATKVKWEEVWNHAKKGDITEIEPRIRIQFYHSLKKIEQDYMKVPKDLDDYPGIWFYGEPDTGKSRAARALYPGAYDKPCNKWWSGYQGQKFVIIDDFEKDHKCLGHHLKRWGDLYSFPVEHKGHDHQVRPEKIIVTSNYHPEEIWGDDPVFVKAILKRFKLTKFEMVFSNPWCKLNSNRQRKKPRLERSQDRLFRPLEEEEMNVINEVDDSPCPVIVISDSDEEEPK